MYGGIGAGGGGTMTETTQPQPTGYTIPGFNDVLF
jgi:hypothetical protein